MPITSGEQDTRLQGRSADLVKRDAELAGLATLLDPEAFVDALRRASSTREPKNAEITYLKYEPHSHCLAGYQLQIAGMAVPAFAIAYRSQIATELEKARSRTSIAGALGRGCIVLEDCAAVVWVFPNDRKIRGLPVLADDYARPQCLRELVPDRPDLWQCSTQHLAYKPRRRYVARLRADGVATAVLKLYNDDGYAAARPNALAFVERESLRLPRLLGRSDKQRMLVFEWLPGYVLSEAVNAFPRESIALSRLGAALAELHAQSPDGLRQLTREAEAVSVRHVARALGLCFSSLALRAHEIAARLTGLLIEGPLQNQPIHGDFSAMQVLVDGDQPAILDLDRAVRGDPAFDLGNFIGSVQYEVRCSDLPRNRARVWCEQLLSGYGTGHDPRILTRINGYAALALFRRLNPFRYWQPAWRTSRGYQARLPADPGQVEALLDCADRLLQTDSVLHDL